MPAEPVEAPTSAPAAQAQPTSLHVDRVNQFSVDLPLGFALKSGSDALGSYQDDAGMSFSLSRISYPALPAWRKNQREAFFEKIAEGEKVTIKFRRRNRTRQIELNPI